MISFSCPKNYCTPDLSSTAFELKKQIDLQYGQSHVLASEFSKKFLSFLYIKIFKHKLHHMAHYLIWFSFFLKTLLNTLKPAIYWQHVLTPIKFSLIDSKFEHLWSLKDYLSEKLTFFYYWTRKRLKANHQKCSTNLLQPSIQVQWFFFVAKFLNIILFSSILIIIVILKKKKERNKNFLTVK